LVVHVLITNNTAVVAKYPMHTRFIKGSVSDVFCAVRDEIHKGATLISHPLSGSIKPNESPYKSIAIAPTTGPLEYKSLCTIEDAISTLARLPDRQRSYSESVLEDFRIIDLDLISHIK